MYIKHGKDDWWNRMCNFLLQYCADSWSGVQPLEERACGMIGNALTDTAVQWLIS